MKTIEKKEVAVKTRTVAVKKNSASPVRDILHDVAGWSSRDKIDVIEGGISKQEFEKIKKDTGLDYETLARILAVTKATLHNKKGAEKFNIVVSERLVLLAELYIFGIEVFGQKDKFNEWLVSDIMAIGFKKPVSMLNTIMGMQEVKNMIGRIAHGIFA